MTYATQARTLDDIAADNHVFSIIAMTSGTRARMFTAVGLDATDDDLRMAKADVAPRADPGRLRPAVPTRPTASRPSPRRRRWPWSAACSSPPNRPSGAATRASRVPTATRT